MNASRSEWGERLAGLALTATAPSDRTNATSGTVRSGLRMWLAALVSLLTEDERSTGAGSSGAL